MSDLKPVLVADFSDLSGAFGGRALAGLGARVVRVGEPDDGRRSNVYARSFYDRGTRRLSADEGVDALIRDADIVLTTGTPTQLSARGLDYAALAAVDPQTIVVNVSPFGLSGPRAEWRSSNLVAVANGGMLFVNGWPDQPPLQPLGLQAYHVAGVQAAIGALLALRVRDRGGGGQLVDISLQESVIASLEHVTATYRESGTIAQRSGTLHWTKSFRTVRAHDAEILATHLGDWDALSEWIASEVDESDALAPCWRDPQYRLEHSEDVFDRIESMTARHDAAELVDRAQLLRLPFAPVWTLDRAALHPQLAARDFFERIDIDGSPVVAQRRCLPLPSLDGVLSKGTNAATPTARGVPPSAGGALAGVRVVDLTWVVAGPAATRILADHGAEVVKVEHPRTATDGPRRSGMFGNLNRGKKSVVIDPTTTSGLRSLLRLIRSSDVLIENFSPRVLVNWGLEDSTLLEQNPQLTIVHLSGYGRDGPCADWVSFGPTLQAMLGFTAHMRHPGGRAAGWGYSFSDMVAGQVAALATIAALQAGGGRVVDLSQLEVLASLVGPELMAAANGVAPPAAIGNRSQEGLRSPHGVYRCRDGDGPVAERWCAISVMSDSEWQALQSFAHLALDRMDELSTAAGRVRRSDEIDSEVGRWTRSRRVASVVAGLQSVGVPCGAVATAADLFADDHLRDRRAFVELPDNDGGTVGFDATAIRLSSTPGEIAAPGPLLDEHGAEILRLSRS